MKSQSAKIDRVGICLSICCGIHCLISISLLTIGTLGVVGLAVNERIEVVISLAILFVGITAILPNMVRDRNYTLMSLFISGFVLLKISDSVESSWMQYGLLSIGIVMIITAHYLNLRSKKRHFDYIKSAKRSVGYEGFES